MTDPFENAHSDDVERAVLSVLLDGRVKDAPAIFQEACPTAEHFWNAKHQLIAKTIHLMVSANRPVDLLSVKDALGQIRFLDAMDKDKGRRWRFEDGLDERDSLLAHVGSETLHNLYTNALGSFSGFRGNCELLADYHTQRRMIRVLLEGVEVASGTGGRSKVVAHGDKMINAIAETIGASAVSTTIDEAMAAALRNHDAAMVRGESIVATWGLEGLDRILPLRGGRLIVLAAAPGCGKTSLALQSAQATQAKLGPGSAAIVSREMDAEELASILIARSIKCSTRAIESGWLKPHQREAAEEVRQRWAGTNLAVKGMAGRCAVEDMTSWIRQRYLRSGGKLRMVAIDYLQLIDPSNNRQTPFERISVTTRALKLLAGELRICILLLSQLSREGRKGVRDRKGAVTTNPEPRKEDLAGSGSIEQDADGILFIWTESTEPAGQMPVHLKIGKNRKGREGSIDAIFDKENGQVFREMVTSQQSDDPADSSRAHHNHQPEPEEDHWQDRAGATA